VGKFSRSWLLFAMGMTVVSIVFIAVFMPRHISVKPPVGAEGSPLPNPGGAVDQARDAGAVAGARSIVAGIEVIFAQEGVLPANLAVAPNGSLAGVLPDWPLNPWNDEPMHSGREKGDYIYDRVSDGEYTFTVTLSSGEQKVH